MTARFHLPGITTHFDLNMYFIELFRSEPQLFRENTEIASVYGTLPPAVWNGGRTVRGVLDLEQCAYIIQCYNAHNIPLRFTFTNPMLEERHLKDEFCNIICQMAENGMNEIIIFSPMLEEYLRRTYPKFTYTSSTCKQIEDIGELEKELEKDYRLVVLDYNWNNRFDVLEKLPHKEKCELLLNAICVSHCPHRGEHYRFLGRQQIYVNEMLPIAGPNAFTMTSGNEKDFRCPFNTSLEKGTNQKTYLSPESVYEKYLPMGFENFKIEGRTYTDEEMLGEYIKYMAKPECADEVREKMLAHTEPAPENA